MERYLPLRQISAMRQISYWSMNEKSKLKSSLGQTSFLVLLILQNVLYVVRKMEKVRAVYHSEEETWDIQ